MKQYLKWTLICLIAVVAGLYLQIFGLNLPVKKPSTEPPQISGFFWPYQKALLTFSMVDQDGTPFELDSLSGKWHLLFFGYTYCPDICPVTMYTMQQLDKQIREQDDPIQLYYVFVSVDGERDTPQRLKQYISYFGSSFVAATGNKQQVDSLTSQFGVPYKIYKKNEQDRDYLVDHSGSLFLISPQNTLAAIFHTPHDVATLRIAISKIIHFMQQKTHPD